MEMLLRTLYFLSVLSACLLSEKNVMVEGLRRQRTEREPVEHGAGGKIRRYRSNNGRLGEHKQHNDAEDYGNFEEIDPEEILNPASNEDGPSLGRHQIDPKGSWLTFVRYSDEKKSDSKPDKRKKKRNKKKRRKLLHGPPGPRGPQGLPGPAGPSVSKEEIIAELTDLIKETSEKRAHELLKNMLYGDDPTNETSLFQQDVTSQLLSLPRVHAGFSLRLAEKVVVRRKTFTELMMFQQPFGDGCFQRGDNFNMEEGRFTAPRGGIYQFTANLHLRVRNRRRPKGRTKSDESIKVVVCIDSKCQTNSSIETISGVFPETKVFTVSVTGLLHMKEKQYASVYVDNSSSQNVAVLSGSEYSGVFLGA